MACLNTPQIFDQTQAFHTTATTAPRISFSNDFVDLRHPAVDAYTEAPVSSDFAFSAPSNALISADELFCNGKMLPLGARTTTTLRDELLARDDDDCGGDVKAAKGTSRWKQRLGLRRALGVVPKKCGRSNNMERIDEMKASCRDGF